MTVLRRGVNIGRCKAPGLCRTGACIQPNQLCVILLHHWRIILVKTIRGRLKFFGEMWLKLKNAWAFPEFYGFGLVHTLYAYIFHIPHNFSKIYTVYHDGMMHVRIMLNTYMYV